MMSSLADIVLQSLEIFSPENKKKLISALTILQIITLYILTFQIYSPWFPSSLAVITILINEVAIGRSLITDIISQISRESHNR